MVWIGHVLRWIEEYVRRKIIKCTHMCREKEAWSVNEEVEGIGGGRIEAERPDSIYSPICRVK